MRLSKSRLGELLVKNKLITEDQLILAMKLQKSAGEDLAKSPLGQVLVDMGFISPGELWRTLAKQTAYRSMTAMVTLFIGFSSFGVVKSARADTFSSQKEQVTTASVLSVPNFNKDVRSQNLFGSAEKRSTNMSAFTKWNTAISRTHSVSLSSSEQWVQDIQKFRGLSEAETIQKVNSYANRVRYVEDNDNYNKSDYWATPSEFFARGAGDCEDYALAKFKALELLGFSKSNMRLAVVHDKVKNIPHAILVVYTKEGAYILDNQTKVAMKADKINRYRPIYSINESAWWRHVS